MARRFLRALRARHDYATFAKQSGLVYFGSPEPDDDFDAPRGFTANAGQVDSFVSSGTVQGRDVVLLERTVTHTSLPHQGPGSHSHTWLILRVMLTEGDVPGVLVLSHEHPLVIDEATYLHQNRSKRLTTNTALDTTFSLFGKPIEAEAAQTMMASTVAERLLTNPSYDYEVDAGHLYIYATSLAPTAEHLNHLLQASLALAEAIDAQ